MVLVTGGTDEGEQAHYSASSLYDPVAGTWTATGSMTTLRANHTATLLPNGTVLVAGGFKNEDLELVGSAEIYDPATGTWSSGGTLAMSVAEQTATLLQNGEVLIAGGVSGSSGTATGPSGQAHPISKLEPFMVKQIAATEFAAYFTRDAELACHT